MIAFVVRIGCGFLLLVLVANVLSCSLLLDSMFLLVCRH